MKKLIALIAIISIVSFSAFAAVTDGYQYAQTTATSGSTTTARTLTGDSANVADKGAQLDVSLTVTPKYEIGFARSAVSAWSADVESNVYSSLEINESTGVTNPATVYAYMKTTSPVGFNLKLKATELTLSGGTETIAYTVTIGDGVVSTVTVGADEATTILTDSATSGLSARGDSASVTLAADPDDIAAATAGSYSAILYLTLEAK